MKDPRKIAAGRASQAAQRRTLGEAAYRQRQQARGAQSHVALRKQLGDDGYRQRQQRGYRAACAAAGGERVKWAIRFAHQADRQRRLTAPTAGEAALHQHLTALSYTLVRDPNAFEVLAHLRTPTLPAVPTAHIEARVGWYYVDAYLPHLHLAIEVDGGVHRARVAHDARRVAFFDRVGLRIIHFSNEELLADDGLAALTSALAPYLQQQEVHE